jgi:hypothetical protein
MPELIIRPARLLIFQQLFAGQEAKSLHLDLAMLISIGIQTNKVFGSAGLIRLRLDALLASNTTIFMDS